MGRKLTARDIIDSGIKPMLPWEYVRDEILRRISSLAEKGLDRGSILQSLYPNTILDTETLEALTAALIAGNNILLFGPPGSGKTNLAKDVWALFPKQHYVVDGCPVQDDPFSVVDPEFSRKVPPCPYCKARFGGTKEDEEFEPEKVDPTKVPVKMVRFMEGYGFSRVQGSPEVFPDNLTGTINIHKLEEIGDPTSPLVMEPGKLLQANRGVLMVDEVGKLPKGTQNVLLQALQEGIVTPAKSRATFPANFIAITTSNMDDLDNINEPLNDRLSNIYVGFSNHHVRNRMIVDISKTNNHLFFPEIFLEADVYLIEDWRKVHTHGHELSEVSSNRTMIDIVSRSEAYAMMNFMRYVDLESFTKGTVHALLGRIRARSGDSYMQSNITIEEFVNKHFDESLRKAAREYWCRFYTDVLKKDKAEAKRVIAEVKIAMENKDEVEKMIKSSDYKKFQRFTKFIADSERKKGPLNHIEIVKRVLCILKTVKLFEEKDLIDII